MDGMNAKDNEGMASTQVMLRTADILNGRGSIEDVEPALQAAVSRELDMYMNQRKNTVWIHVHEDQDATKDAGTVEPLEPEIETMPAQPVQEPKEADLNGPAIAQ